jgi:hypothetical protein
MVTNPTGPMTAADTVARVKPKVISRYFCVLTAMISVLD